jgi:hypothetical protein
MVLTRGEHQKPIIIEEFEPQDGQVQSCPEDAVSLRHWLVSFASGREWYPVGEYVALDAQAAIERAIDVFGLAAGYQAEEIPWDAAPLLKLRPAGSRSMR